MANDLMRTGPRGSSNQDASVGPQQFTFVDNATGTTGMLKAGASTAYADKGSFATAWRVIAIQLRVTVTFVANDIAIDIGTTTGGEGDAYVNGYATGSATSAAGSVFNVPLNGTNVPLLFGDTPNGQLLLTNPDAADVGRFVVTVFAEPVSGRFYST